MATRESLESKRQEMAMAYLTYGTVRKAEYVTGYSKTSIHKAVKGYIERGGFDRVDELKALIARNKSERHIRGGQATKRKYGIIKSVINETCVN